MEENLIREFWDNGQVKRTYFSENESGKYGEDTFYYRNGKVNKIQHWENDILQGASSIFYKTGEKYIEKNYKDGNLDGEYVVFSKNGAILKTFRYKDGEKIFECANSEFVEKNERVDLKQASKPTLIDSREFRSAETAYKAVKATEKKKDTDKKKSGVLPTLKKIGKVATGIQGYQDRKSVNSIKEACEKYQNAAYEATQAKGKHLNSIVEAYDKRCSKTLEKTIGVFLGLLEDMEQENRNKEYEMSKGVSVKTQHIGEMQNADITAAEALGGVATVGALSSAASVGAPKLTMAAVGAFGKASTGAAISTLSGAAKAKASMAFLGGGAKSVGGGGIAKGVLVLGGIKVAAAASVAVVVAGTLASAIYSKKLTKAKEYQKETEIAVANMKKSWTVLEGINKRVSELRFVMTELEKRILARLKFLEPLTVNYDFSDEYYNSIFQQTGLMVETMRELAETPLVDQSGNLTKKSAQIIEHTYKILNKDIANNNG